MRVAGVLSTIVLGLLVTAPARATATERVLVVNTGSDSVSLVDLETLRELERYEVGESPYGVAVSRDGRTVAVGIEGEGVVRFFDAADFSLRAEVRIGPMHHDHIVLSPDGSRILVANFHSDSVVLIDPVAMKEVGRIEGASAPHVVKYGPSGKRAFVTCKKITGIAIIDPARQALVKFHQINVNPRSLTFSPDGSKVYFGSFWVDGFFQMDAESGEVERLFRLPTPEGSGPQEVTYHGVETVGPSLVLAANEGRSYVDSVDVTTGALVDRLDDVSKPCCIERIPGGPGSVRVLVSNIGDGTLQLVEVSREGRMRSVGKAKVGKAPKRVALLPASAP